MPTEVRTVHEKEDGEQVTTRIVDVIDATGSTTTHRFRVTDDGHEYLEDGEPTETVREALEEHEDGSDVDR